MEKVKKRLLGVEDINWDNSGNGEQDFFITSTGDKKTLRKLNESHIPVSASLREALGEGVVYLQQALLKMINMINTSTGGGGGGGGGGMSGDKTVTFSASMSAAEMQLVIDEQMKNLGQNTLTFKFPENIYQNINQKIVFSDFFNGKIIIDGNGSTVRDTGNIGAMFLFDTCIAPVRFENFIVSIENSPYAIEAIASLGIFVNNCRITGREGTYGVHAVMSDADYAEDTIITGGCQKITGYVYDWVKSNFLSLKGGTISNDLAVSNDLTVKGKHVVSSVNGKETGKDNSVTIGIEDIENLKKILDGSVTYEESESEVTLKKQDGNSFYPEIKKSDKVALDDHFPVTSDAVAKAIKYVGFGLPIGAIFGYPGAIPPEGAYLLNGQTIAGCNELYPKFWEWVQSAGVRIIDNDTYEAELAATGVCGGFVINSATGSVRLPSVVNGTLWGADISNIGQSLAAGLPNITGTFSAGARSNPTPASGSFTVVKTGDPNLGFNADANEKYDRGIDFDASRSSSVYGNSDTVQPPAIRVSLCIQVFNATTALSEQESAQLASQMQMKAQTNLANVDSNIDYMVESWRDGWNWYRKYRSGWVEQGGLYVATTTGEQTINLNVEMGDTQYHVVLGHYNEANVDTNTGASLAYSMAAKLTTTSFCTYCGGSAILRQKFWKVCGYAATE